MKTPNDIELYFLMASKAERLGMYLYMLTADIRIKSYDLSNNMKSGLRSYLGNRYVNIMNNIKKRKKLHV
jgi:hypothetical protein